MNNNKKMTRKTKDEKRRLAFKKRNVKKEMNLARFGAESGSALVMAKTTDFNRRLVAAFMALVFALTTIIIGVNLAVRADDAIPLTDADDGSNLVLDKAIFAEPNGDYTLKLSAFAKGAIKNTTKQIPTDYILVIDQSGSMQTRDMPEDYVHITTPSGGWSFDDFNIPNSQDDKAYYIKESDVKENGSENKYCRVYRKWGDLFELVPRNSLYIQDVLDRRGLGWFQPEESEEQSFNSSYYYRPASDPLIATLDPEVKDDANFYPVDITARGGQLSYFITFKYKDSLGNSRTAKYYNGDEYYSDDLESTNAMLYKKPLSWRNPVFGPGDSYLGLGYDRVNNAVLYHADNNNITSAAGVLIGDTTQPKKPRDQYTYAKFTAISTGMFIQNPLFIRHVGYNALACRDSNGVEYILTSTDYCDVNGNPTSDEHGAIPFKDNSIELYQATGENKTRVDSLKTALNGFVDKVAKQTDTEGFVDHRIAIVGFSSSGYNNDELLTNENYVVSGVNGIPKTGSNGADRNTSYYTNALIPARANDNGDVNPAVTAGINALTAEGGTQPETGLEMAYNILNNNKSTARYNEPDDNGDSTRNAVVIFFTDGRPGDYNTDNQYDEANEVVSMASNIKQSIPGVTIYSVGVFGESDGNPLTYYESLTNWIGWDTTKTFLEKDRLLNDFSQANDRDKADYGRVTPSLDNYNDYVSNYAEKTYYPDFYKEDGITTIQSFKFEWRSGVSISYNKSWTGPGYVHTISGTFWRDCLRNTANYPKVEDDTIFDYMTVVSSSYPSATSFDNGWSHKDRSEKMAGNYISAIANVRKEKAPGRYYMSATDSEGLNEIFVNIAKESTSSAVPADVELYLQDEISDNFSLPSDYSEPDKISKYVTVQTLKGHQNKDGSYSFNNLDTADTLTDVAHWNGKTLTIDSDCYSFSDNYISYGKPANEQEGTTDNEGKKIIVTIKGLTPIDKTGVLVSNGQDSGIIMKEAGNAPKLINGFNSPAIIRQKVILNVGQENENAKFNVEYTLTPGQDVTPHGTSIVVRDRNGQAAKRYDQLEAGKFDATDNSGNKPVGTDTAVYVEYITKQGTTDPDAPATVNPADYNVSAKVTPTGDNSYTYYLSSEQFLYGADQVDEAVIPSNDTKPVIVEPTTNTGNLYVTSKANNHSITVKNETVKSSEQDEDYSDPTKKFPIKITLIKTDTNAPDITSPISGVTFTDGVGVVSLANKDEVTLTLPVGYTVKVEDASDPSAYSTTYKLDDVATDSPITNTSDDHIIVVRHERDKDTIATTGVTDDDGSNSFIYILAGVGALTVGAGVAYVYRKKDELVKR